MGQRRRTGCVRRANTNEATVNVTVLFLQNLHATLKCSESFGGIPSLFPVYELKREGGEL
jgi:hypothetical protein